MDETEILRKKLRKLELKIELFKLDVSNLLAYLFGELAKADRRE